MKNIVKKTTALILAAMLLFAFAAPAYAASMNGPQGGGQAAVEQTVEEEGQDADGTKALAAAICVGLAAFAGALGMGYTVAKTNESVARQPEAAGDIRGSMMLGLVFIETAIIYALIVAILIIFVL